MPTNDGMNSHTNNSVKVGKHNPASQTWQASIIKQYGCVLSEGSGYQETQILEMKENNSKVGSFKWNAVHLEEGEATYKAFRRRPKLTKQAHLYVDSPI
eukprot:8440703-Ditylum_brightwellii.AAC.1